jgi:hypothetical protein
MLRFLRVRPLEVGSQSDLAAVLLDPSGRMIMIPVS